MISLCLAVQAQDFEKITSMCDGLCDELNDFRKQLEVETTEPDCQQFLLFTLSGVKSYKPHTTGMVDGEHIGENDDSDEASDPQYEVFFERLNKYEKSYLLEGKIIDVSACVKYEGDSKFGGKRKPKCARKNHQKKCARKMRRDDGRVDGAAEQSPSLPNEQAPVNQHASDNVNDRRNEISKEKPDLRHEGIIKESEVGFTKSLSTKMANSGSCNVSKIMTVVQEDNIVTDNQSEPHGQAPLGKADKGEDVDKALVDQHASDHVEDNTVTDNQSGPHGQSELHGQARLTKADKGEDVDKAPVNQHAFDNVDDRRKEISKKKPDLRNKGTIKESEVGFFEVLSKKMDNLGSCKVLKIVTVIQEDNIVTDNQSEPHGQAPLGNADKGEDVDKALVDQHASDHVEDNIVTDNQSEPHGQSELHGQARLRKADKGEDVDKAPVNQNASDHVDDRRNEMSKKKPDIRNKGIIKEKADKGEYVDKAHYVPDSESVMQISYDGNGYQSPDPINNSESKNQSDPKHNSATKYQAVRANQVVPSEEDKEAQSKTNMPKVKKEKNVVTDDCVGNRKAVHYRDNEPLYPKPSSEKNMEEHQHEDADLTQPCKKHKVQGQRKLRKVVRGSHEIEVDDAASRNDVAQTKNKLLFHKPCSSKNQVTKNCIDQPRPKQRHSMFMKERDITDGSDSDVEILDSASFYRTGNPGPFVTSKKFHKSMMEDDNIKLPERTSPQFEFRRQVMNVLQKPYDKQESNRLREAFMAGSYVKFHPDLVKKLAAHRYEKGKCLAILRGFFFWLENLTKQGSFKPWEDSECLGVDPALL